MTEKVKHQHYGQVYKKSFVSSSVHRGLEFVLGVAVVCGIRGSTVSIGPRQRGNFGEDNASEHTTAAVETSWVEHLQCQTRCICQSNLS